MDMRYGLNKPGINDPDLVLVKGIAILGPGNLAACLKMGTSLGASLLFL